MDACSFVKRDLGRFQDGELPEEQGLLLKKHLEGCPQCAGEYAALQSIGFHLDDLSVPPVPETLLPQVVREARRRKLERRPEKGLVAVWCAWPLPARLAVTAALAMSCYVGIILGSGAAFSHRVQSVGGIESLWIGAGTSIVEAYAGGGR